MDNMKGQMSESKMDEQLEKQWWTHGWIRAAAGAFFADHCFFHHLRYDEQKLRFEHRRGSTDCEYG